MKPVLQFLTALGSTLVALPAAAILNVFACEQEWAALTNELAGDKTSTYSATTALNDVHKIEARPSLIARARTADLVICSGSELEAGWLPLLLKQSGNNRIQPGSPGFLEASQFVARLEIPKVLDRAMGDIHASGNPHVHLDPRNIARVAEVITDRLVLLDPANAGWYRARADSFQERWKAAMSRWQLEAARLKGVSIVVYHKDMSYFMNWAGMREAGSLEPKPGLPATPAHLAELVERMKRDPAKAVVYSPYNSPRAAEFLSQRAGIPSVMLPFTVGGTENAKDLFGLFDETIARLLAVMK
jgi:zinc/manganese transport system substrate-binding protein